MDISPPEIMITNDALSCLTQLLASDKSGKQCQRTVFLTPRVWGGIDQEWKTHPNVLLVPFRISNNAWPVLNEVLGIPLKSSG